MRASCSRPDRDVGVETVDAADPCNLRYTPTFARVFHAYVTTPAHQSSWTVDMNRQSAIPEMAQTLGVFGQPPANRNRTRFWNAVGLDLRAGAAFGLPPAHTDALLHEFDGALRRAVLVPEDVTRGRAVLIGSRGSAPRCHAPLSIDR